MAFKCRFWGDSRQVYFALQSERMELFFCRKNGVVSTPFLTEGQEWCYYWW